MNRPCATCDLPADQCHPTVWPKGLRVTDRHVVVTIRADDRLVQEALDRALAILAARGKVRLLEPDGGESWEFGLDAMRWQP